MHFQKQHHENKARQRGEQKLTTDHIHGRERYTNISAQQGYSTHMCVAHSEHKQFRADAIDCLLSKNRYSIHSSRK